MYAIVFHVFLSVMIGIKAFHFLSLIQIDISYQDGVAVTVKVTMRVIGCSNEKFEKCANF